MVTKAGNMGMDGKNQTTTDTEITTTDILKHRHIGRFLERTQYFQRRVVIPLDVPKTVREVTPSRSGLRKRKMVEAPKLSQPIVTEEWVDEDRLELWVIKQYHERIEKAAAMAAAASTTTSTPHLTRLKSTPQTMGPGGKPMTMEELKAQAEQQLRAQRTAHQLKSTTPGTPTGVVRLTLPAGNKVMLPGNKLLSTPSGATGSPMGRRILITKDGKTSQVVKTTVASPSGSAQPVLIAPSPGVAAATPTVNKLQISRGPDGKIEIRGLKPGQQLLKLSDGRFTIVSPAQPMITAQPAPAQAQTQIQPAAASDGTGTKTVVVQKAVTIAGQKTTSQIVLPAGTNTAMLAQHLASGKLQLSSVNGQQVIIRPAATPASAGSATVVKTGDTPTVVVAGQQQPAKPMMQVIQTAQGQKIIVQNLQGGSLTPQQLAAIQEQLKGQMMARTNQPGGNNKPITFAVRTSVAGATVATVSTTAAVTTTVAPTST
jgi:nucleosome-remodeling factor subunit BPTF